MQKQRLSLTAVSEVLRQIADYLAQEGQQDQEKKRAQWRRWQANYRAKRAVTKE